MIRTLLHTAVFLAALGSAAFSNAGANAQTLVLQGGKIYPSPDAAPLGGDVRRRHHSDRQPW
jgi:hypothetical protein